MQKNSLKYTFSGHESFQCRHLWLKKGYDFVHAGKSFTSEDAVVELGVGKNMVAAIRYWMKAFDLLDQNDTLTELANNLLGKNGWDPYLEDEASLWLLHYHLVKKGVASTYHLIFNELRKEKIEFSKNNFIAFVKRKAESTGAFQANEKTLSEDFGVLAKMYIRSDAQSKDKEDTFSGLLTELDLIKSFGKRGEEFFVIENNEKNEIPDEVILYGILQTEGLDASISLSTIEQEPNQVGTIFAINRSGLLNKIESIASKNSKHINFNDHAGIKELQFKKRFEPFEVLNKYYNAN